MKVILIIAFFFFCQCARSQHALDSIYLELVSYKDTIREERDGKIKVRVINASNYPIIVPDHDGVYLTLIDITRNDKDSIIPRDRIIKMDGYTPPSFQVLESKRSKEFGYSVFEGYITRAGLYKLKLSFDLKSFNKNYRDIETKWFYVFINKIDGIIY